MARRRRSARLNEPTVNLHIVIPLSLYRQIEEVAEFRNVSIPEAARDMLKAGYSALDVKFMEQILNQKPLTQEGSLSGRVENGS